MKRNPVKAMAFIIAACMLTSVVGCKNKKDEHNNVAGDNIPDDFSMTEKDMPFGATITQLKPSNDETVRIGIDYDNRFMTEAEARLVSDYVAALNTIDAELMEKTIYPDYLKYLIESSEAADTKDYLQQIHDDIEQKYTGEGMDMNYVVTTNLTDNSDPDTAAGFSQFETTFPGISEKTTSRKLVSFDIMYKLNGEGSYSLSNRMGGDSMLYIYEIDGQLYII